MNKRNCFDDKRRNLKDERFCHKSIQRKYVALINNNRTIRSMCGFSGIISNQMMNGSIIEQSLRSIKHRGPDDSLLFSEEGFCYSTNSSNESTQKIYPSVTKKDLSKSWLGFNRLAIVDLSDKGMQPFYDKDSGCVFMMNGEIYNYKEIQNTFLADELFVSESDGEVAFKLYLKQGVDFVHTLQGMFSIVIYHTKEKKVLVFRDRLGIKPFYYSLTKDAFVFSSEIKGILETELVKKEVCPQGLAYSMYLGTCPSPLTIYQNIQSLQPGHSLLFQQEDMSLLLSTYWTLTYSPNTQTIDSKEFSEDVKKLCTLYLAPEVKRAIMLSGGLDSGILAYFLAQQDPKLTAISLYQENELNDEREYTIKNAKNAKISLDLFAAPAVPSESLITTLLVEEEPNTGPEPTTFISLKAHEKNCKVLYNALGPDELFGGYPYYQKIHQLNFARFLLPLIPAGILPKRYKNKLREIKQFGLAFFALISRSTFSWEEVKEELTLQNMNAPHIHPIHFIKNQILEIYPDFNKMHLLKQVSYIDLFYYVSSHHSFRSDQPSMKYGIEMRFPFLDHQFIEKYFSQRDTFENIGTNLKPKFRSYIHSFLNKKNLEMPKKGFFIEFKEWNAQRWYKHQLGHLFNK